jgi:hypothetical protein
LTVALEAVRITSNFVPFAGVAAEVNIIEEKNRASERLTLALRLKFN